VHLVSQPTSIDSATNSLFKALLGGRVITYYGRGVGPILNESLGGLFGPLTVQLNGCHG
jgi:hypothetical protein